MLKYNGYPEDNYITNSYVKKHIGTYSPLQIIRKSTIPTVPEICTDLSSKAVCQSAYKPDDLHLLKSIQSFYPYLCSR